MKMCRWIFTILLLTSSLNLSGCWDRQEIGEIRLTMGLAIEMTNDGRYRVIAQDINPRLTGNVTGTAPEFAKAYRNIVGEGDSVYEAVNKLALITASQRFLSHTQVIIVSEELAREKGVYDVLDYFDRNPQFRNDIWFIIGKGSLIDLMDVGGRISLIPSLKIREVIDSNQMYNFIVPLPTGQFITLLQSESTQAYTAGVEIQNNSIPNQAEQEIMNGQVPEPLLELTLKSTAVFRQDKLAGWLDIKESHGLQWVRGEFKKGSITFDNPEVPGKKIGASVLSCKTELKPQISNGNLSIIINIELESYLQQVEGNIDLRGPEGISSLEAAQEKHVKEEVEAALKKAQQEFNVDIFGLGEAIHRSYPEKWQEIKADWSEVFPDINVEVQVKSLIRDTSTTTNSIVQK